MFPKNGNKYYMGCPEKVIENPISLLPEISNKYIALGRPEKVIENTISLIVSNICFYFLATILFLIV
jgi:hypothetical protein